MKKKILLSLSILFTALIVFFSCQKSTLFDKNQRTESTQFVTLDSARSIAVHFNPSSFFNASNGSNHSPFHSTLTGNNVIKNYTTINDKQGTPAIYVFNFTNDNGFLFVSADYRLRPVLAFIERGNFKKDTVPPGLIQWAGKTVNDIEIVRKGLYDNASIAKKEWRAYIENGSLMSGNVDNATSNPDMLPPPPDDNPCISDPNYYTSTTQTVGPLLPVTWGRTVLIMSCARIIIVMIAAQGL